ncbi:MAG TPA: hypothetical protein VLQ20_05275 [Planococcus sp. (in: firmicutes)]|nr:hypothetical protein [Planococcus sp. (in: firmicutes)]
MNSKLWIAVSLSALLAAGCGAENEAEPAPAEDAATEEAQQGSLDADDFEVDFEGTVEHVHGMGYIEGDGLYFASHEGLKIYRDGKWVETDGMHNDYMGFNAVDRGFYTSGHPGNGSGMMNPIGIQRSMDGGRSLEHMGFEGETDFHAMAVGYRSHHMFVMNPQPNSGMGAGFFRSENEGQDWSEAAAEGLEGEISYLAMHPDDSQLIAAATSTGVYLSQDGGASFKALTSDGQFGTALTFSEDALYYASYETVSELVEYELETGDKKTLALPELPEDGVLYIAQRPDELAIYTVKGQAFISGDKGAEWTQIMEDGEVR